MKELGFGIQAMNQIEFLCEDTNRKFEASCLEGSEEFI
jgi:hypothetical protein